MAHLCSAFNNSKRTVSLLLVRADIADDTPIITVLRNSLAIQRETTVSMKLEFAIEHINSTGLGVSFQV